ncbi:dihydroorotate dehydrogenase [Fusobacterium sp. IOR10]|uniref:dihydroorotate dehydrogenase n=1 Tax=Fusobacterium sp. IOR10 TaxID=2665157 RepID=UPI0013D4F6A6|nr:dihydroorotate dehydrogenase [Fusobacterium sp. IOR10]
MNKLNVNFLGIEFNNPILTSSGCFGFGLEYKDYFDPNELGGIVLKGLTLEPRTGNLGTRIAETPSGMLNCVGLENPGIDVLENEIIPNLMKQNINTKIIVNINGSTLEQYVEIAKRVNKIKEIHMVELNISCPNVKDGGMAFGANPEVAGKITKEVKKVLDKPLIVKLSPNVTNIVEIAKIVEENGADAISMINTLLGMKIDIKKGTPILGNTFGGLSGPAVRPVAVRMVYQVAQNISIPIVGMGGINSWEDAVEFIMAGATMVSIGTGIFPNPLLPLEIKEGLNSYCIENNLNNLQDIKGIAFKK